MMAGGSCSREHQPISSPAAPRSPASISRSTSPAEWFALKGVASPVRHVLTVSMACSQGIPSNSDLYRRGAKGERDVRAAQREQGWTGAHVPAADVREPAAGLWLS